MQSGALSRAILLHPSLKESVTSISFSTSEELLWSGTATGGLFALQCPDLLTYSTVRAHKVPILDSSPLGDGVTSVSQEWVRWHSSGGVPRATLTVVQAEVEAFTAICTELHSRGQAMVGYRCAAAAGANLPAENGVALVDLFTGKVVSKAALAEPVYLMRPAARGLIALGSPGGAVALVDPRAGFKVQHSVAAHAAGLADMDARADSLATCGYGTRQGTVVAENYVKVYDLRLAPRMTASVPFPAGPSLLRFHPKFSSTILIASSLGTFTLADTSGAAFSRYERLETEGDTITACDVSASGEEIAFGSAAGYLYLWVMGSPTEPPRVNAYSQPLEVPLRVPPPPASPLAEDDSFALAAVYPAGQGRLLSDMSAIELAQNHRPPRLVHPLVAAGLKQVDFVGHAQNPNFKRGIPRGEAARAAAPLRNLRLEAKPEKLELVDVRAERERKRAAAGQSGLPEGYRYLTLRQVHSSRFDDFDYALHNPTRFAGLENEIANCYANSLLQVLYFIPELRAAMLAIQPDPSEEFSLADEVTLLFRMLLAGGPAACQATNLLRALRQNKGAAALGLLETHSQRSGENTDIEVETNKEKSLQRRVQSLQRFLLERLKSELAHRKQPPPLSALPEASAAADDDQPLDSSPPDTTEQRVSANSAPDGAPHTAASSSSGDEEGSGEGSVTKGEGGEGERWPAPTELAAGLDCLFGILMQQRIRCLYGEKAEKTQDILSFQVELQYPPAKERPTRAAGAADVPQPLSFRPGEAPKAAALPQWAPDQVRPSFSQLLAASLQPAADMRAWFDERLKYQHVQQQRLPKRLPTVLVVSCGLLEIADLVWWQPYHSHPHRRSCAWLPGAIEIISEYNTSQVTVREADNAADLATPAEDMPEEAPRPEQAKAAEQGTPPAGNNGRTRAVYELAALVAHILEDTGAKEKSSKGKKERNEDEGHIVAHIKVLPPYVQPGQGFMPDAQEASSPGASPLPTGFGHRPRSAPASSRLGPPGAKPGSSEPPLPGAKLGRSEPPLPSTCPSGMDPGLKAQPGPHSGTAHSPGSEGSNDVKPDIFTVEDEPQATATDVSSEETRTEGVLDQALPADSILSAVPNMGKRAGEGATDGRAAEDAAMASATAQETGDVLKLSAEVARLACAEGITVEDDDGSASPGVPGTAADDGAQTLELDRSSEPAALAAARSGSLPASSQPAAPEHAPALPVSQISAHKSAEGHMVSSPDLLEGPPLISLARGIAPGRRAEWLLFNDFCITPTNAAEVTQLYGLQKVPCLLYYKQVDSIEAAAQMPPPQQAPVLSFEAFRQLCNAPPLQGASRLRAPTFQALGPDEEVRPGMLLGIDTEFVAHSPPDKVMRGGVEVETRPSRLGLGRVSVVRGTGALSGKACIDDYIRATEPVFDYLTKWSGLVPGDLDPALSPHNLTTHKAAYLKLRFLVDSGAIFVGHGLKKDFRMLNIVVPPAQVVDTVELFHFKRQRKLSLRFLAGYLLGAAIQKDTHDSIVDARTALSLFEVYEQLNTEGKFQEKLLEMYRWGKANGWDAAPAQQGTNPSQKTLETHVSGDLIQSTQKFSRDLVTRTNSIVQL